MKYNKLFHEPDESLGFTDSKIEIVQGCSFSFSRGSVLQCPVGFLQ